MDTTLKPVGFADVLIGLQYGDEGKARVVDMIADHYDIIARFNGGSNAGHTIEYGDTRIALNQMPSGVFYKDKILYIGSGCITNVGKLAVEIDNLQKIGMSFEGRLFISPQASIVQPHHMLIDRMIGQVVGTTNNGVGPCYADKAIRMYDGLLANIRLCDLAYDLKGTLVKVRANFEHAKGLYGFEGSVDEELAAMETAFEAVRQYVAVDPLFLDKKVEQGARVLFEGAQSIMLDVTRGSVPFVTSSATLTAAAYLGGDLNPKYHRKTIGVAKAIMSRVGHGPFVSELGGKQSEEYCMAKNGDKPMYNREIEGGYDVEGLLKSDSDFEVGQGIRVLSGEYGTVSTRPRRVGMFDLVQLAFAVKMNGVDDLIINKCDLVNVYSRTKKNGIPLVVGYKLNGKEIDYLPASTEEYGHVEPIVEVRQIFAEDVSKMTESENLPAEMKELVNFMEKKIGCKITGIGVGPERDQFVYIK